MKKRINVDEKSTENVKMKKTIKEKISKKEMNLNTRMFENVIVKNSNTQTFMMFYIDDTTSFASIFTSKLLLKFKSFSKIENEASTKAQTKEKNLKKKKNFFLKRR